MSVADFLRDLPCHNPQNFTQFNTDHLRASQKRPSVYLPTEDYPSEQHIVMDKRCVLLRYLTQQWDKKTLPRKREHPNAGGEGGGAAGGPNGAGAGANQNSKKRPRLEPIEMN